MSDAPASGGVKRRVSTRQRVSRIFDKIRGKETQKPLVEESEPQKDSTTAAAPAAAKDVAQSAQTPATSQAVEGSKIADNEFNIAATGPTLNVKLRNHTNSNVVYAYITGLDLNRGNARCFVQADGRSLYYPSSPSSTGAALAVDCAIALPGPKLTRNCILPTFMAGGRVYFSVGSRLTFRLNPGPGLVEPSALNQSDPNYNISWGFCEFTFNSAQMFANISYVDFFGVPIGMTLYGRNGAGSHVSGTNQNGLANIANQLRTQQARDGQPWSNLIVQPGGRLLRVLSPNSAASINPATLSNYLDGYINQVWAKYAGQTLTINTQSQYGNVTGRVQNGLLTFNGASFRKPTTRDVWSCSTGPFAVTSGVNVPIVPRLAAAFNRTTIDDISTQPNGATVYNFYQDGVTNYYSKIVHANNLDGKGYTFPYDDVVRDGGTNWAGVVSAGDATTWILAVGGIAAGLTNAPLDDGVAASF